MFLCEIWARCVEYVKIIYIIFFSASMQVTSNIDAYLTLIPSVLIL